MRNLLEQFLRVAEVHDPARTEQRWTDYRDGVGSSDPTRRATAEAAFTTLISWHGRGIYRYIWGFVRSDFADDIFQDVLRKLHENRNDPRLASFRENVLPWLRRVAIHQCLDAHREEQRRIARETRAAMPESTEMLFPRSEWNEAIAHALANLPIDLQQVIALHYFEGLNGQESAAALGIHRDTFSVRLKSALGQLRKQIQFPSLIAGGFATLPAALAAVPPVARLDKFIPPAAPAAVAWKLKSAMTLALAGLALGGTVTLGLALLPGQPDDPKPPPANVAKAEETLQERNVRLVRNLVAPKLLASTEGRLPDGNSLRLVDVRAFGSAVECEFQTSRPVLPGWKPTGLKVRYCLSVRHLALEADLMGRGEWKSVNPERPIILDLAIPGLPIPALDLGKDLVENTQAEFDRLPDDPRSVSERLKHQFGSGPELLIPTALRGFAADDGKLYVVDRERALSVRDKDGSWAAAGICPGWWLTAHRGRLYCHKDDEILVREADEPNARWTLWSACRELRGNERPGFLTVANDRLFFAIHPDVFVSKPLNAPADPWHRTTHLQPVWPDGIAGAGRRLFGHNQKSLLVRSVDDETTWTPVATWPDEGGFLAVDGDRLIALGGIGAIFARPIDAGPDVAWKEIGRVREPDRK